MQRTSASKLPEQSRNSRALSSKLALWNNLASAFSDWTTGNDYLLQTKSQGSRDIQGALGVAGAFAERGAWLHGRRVLGVEGVWGWLFRRALRPEGVLWVSGVAGDPGRLEKKEGTPWRGPGLRRPSAWAVPANRALGGRDRPALPSRKRSSLGWVLAPFEILRSLDSVIGLTQSSSS